MLTQHFSIPKDFLRLKTKPTYRGLRASFRSRGATVRFSTLIHRIGIPGKWADGDFGYDTCWIDLLGLFFGCTYRADGKGNRRVLGEKTVWFEGSTCRSYYNVIAVF
ncbi:hypothetical protein Zmor_015572 [Zophobas morio]|uniref:Uncharacterized protein n=1 Tax=Zophobas morio TaxID=2755281 RepID=A0AA38MHT5_9CUCU|nr:hypothetical protein Zmor_015572 [Zophobas morio]